MAVGQLGQPFGVENQPGAGTNIATGRSCARRGRYRLLVVAANTVNASLYDKLPFNFIRDIAPVASVSRVPLVVTVHPSVPANSFPEFLAYAKAHPGKINMGSTGNGGTPHLAGELFKMMAGVDLVHTPFRGADGAQAGVVDGHAQVMFSILPEAIANIRAGKLRALAATTAARLEVLPDLPTVGDFVPGYEASTWNGIGVPRATPVEIVDRLMRDDQCGPRRSQDQGAVCRISSTVLPGSAADFGKFIASETEKWAKAVKFAGLKSG